MSEETTNTAAAEEITFEINFPGYSKPVTIVSTKPRKKKNSEETIINFIPKLDAAEVLAFLAAVVDPAKLANNLINEIIKPAAGEATAAARKVDPETGEPTFDEEAYTSCFLDQFNPSSRRSSGESKKELQLRLGALAPVLGEIVAQAAANPDDDSIKNRMAQILVEIQELNAKIEAKSRGPQPGRKSKKAKAEAAA